MTLATLVDWKYGTGFSFRSRDQQPHRMTTRSSAGCCTLTGTRCGRRARARRSWRRCTWRCSERSPGRSCRCRWRCGPPASAPPTASRESSCARLLERQPGVPRHRARAGVRGRSSASARSPGFLALFFFSIAVVTKLTSDTLDGIDTGPIEAATATGARHSQMLRSSGRAADPPGLHVVRAVQLRAQPAGLGRDRARRRRRDRAAPQGLHRRTSTGSRSSAIIVLFIIVVFVVDRLSTLLRRRLV